MVNVSYMYRLSCPVSTLHMTRNTWILEMNHVISFWACITRWQLYSSFHKPHVLPCTKTWFPLTQC